MSNVPVVKDSSGNVVSGHPSWKGNGGGDTPEGGEMERRVEKLETAISEIQIRLIRVESKLDSTATKTDLAELASTFHKSMTEQTWKFITAALGMSSLFAVIAFGVAHILK